MIRGLLEYFIVGEAVIIALIAALSSVMSVRQKRFLKDTESRAVARYKESMLSMHLMSAAVKLGVATAIAVQNKEVNGHMERALKDAEAANEAYEQFINDLAADAVIGFQCKKRGEIY